MKILKTIFLIMGVVFILVILAAVIAIKMIDINKFRHQMTSIVSEQINKRVSLARMAFSFSMGNGVLLLLEGIKVGDIKGGDDYAIEANAVALDVDFWTLVTTQKLNIKSIKLKKPFIKIIQLKKNSKIINRINPNGIEDSPGINP